MTGGLPDARSAGDLLATIVAATRRIVEVRQQSEPLQKLARRAEAGSVRPGAFHSALVRTGRVNVIAECKRRSPSRGVLRNDYDAPAIALEYEAGGAAAVSVLTEPTFFDGSLEHLWCVRQAVSIPVLRKDFIISEYQLFEARAMGADAVLLIVAALPGRELQALARQAQSLGLDVLMEVHTVEELAMAVDAGAQIVGVNNRNLRTLTVDVSASERIAARLPREVIGVSESGLKDPEDLRRLGGLGYRAFLIGERFMTDPSPGRALRSLLDGTVAAAAPAE